MGHLLTTLFMGKEKSLRGWLTRYLPVVSVIAVLLVVCLIPAGARESAKTGFVITEIEINSSNATAFDPAALPAGFGVTREPVDVGVRLNETMLPAPKGEMAAGPRFIGFSLDPIFAATGITILVVIGVGSWYYLRRKQEPDTKE
jgi:hypothetical protein